MTGIIISICAIFMMGLVQYVFLSKRSEMSPSKIEATKPQTDKAMALRVENYVI